MLPNFAQMGEAMAQIVALIERGVVALELIAAIEEKRARLEFHEPPTRESIAHALQEGNDDGS